jgi:hypothetical protein
MYHYFWRVREVQLTWIELYEDSQMNIYYFWLIYMRFAALKNTFRICLQVQLEAFWDCAIMLSSRPLEVKMKAKSNIETENTWPRYYKNNRQLRCFRVLVCALNCAIWLFYVHHA